MLEAQHHGRLQHGHGRRSREADEGRRLRACQSLSFWSFKMAKFDRLSIYQAMLGTGLVPLFYSGDVAEAKAVAGAIADGGSQVLEFTNRGEKALSVFAEVVNANPKLIV